MELKRGYKQTEIGAIPEDWVVTTLNSIVGFRNGKAHEEFISEHGQYVVVNSKFISTNGEVRKYSQFCFAPVAKGEVLMVMSDVPNGRAIAKCFVVDGEDCYTVNQRICALRPVDVDAGLLFYTLNRNPYYLSFDDGVKQTNLRRGDVLACPLAIPSTKTEQEAIAEVLIDADALIKSLEHLLSKKRHLKQGVMQELLAGKRRLPGFRVEWTDSTLGSVTERVVGGGTPSRRIPGYWGGNIPWMTVKDFAHFSPIKTAESITLVGLRNSSSHLIPAGTLITSTRMALGKAVIFDVDVCINQDLKALFTYSDIDPRFLYYWFQLNESSIAEMGSGSTVMGLSLIDLRKIRLKKPPLSEQTAIAEVLSDMDSELSALEQRREKTHALKQSLMQELLTGRTRLV